MDKMRSIMFIVPVLIIAFFATRADGQSKILGTQTLSAAGNAASLDEETIEWNLGEPIIETGINADFNLTQGFEQPMVCRKRPAISGFNLEDCSKPFYLEVQHGFDVYHWYLDNSYVVNQSNNIYYPFSGGEFKVNAGDSSGCYVPATTMVFDYSKRQKSVAVLISGNSIEDTLLTAETASDYQWYVVNSTDGKLLAIKGATNKTYRPYFNGLYVVKTNKNTDCVSYSANYTVNNKNWQNILRYKVNMEDSVINLSKIQLVDVFPVPTFNNTVSIQYYNPAIKITAFRLYNNVGVLLDEQSFSLPLSALNLQYHKPLLPKGNYHLSIQTEGGMILKNIIFQ